MNQRETVVTGATGFLGREIVWALLRRDPNQKIALLVRGRDEADAARRVDEMLREGLSGETLEDGRRRVRAIRSDLEHDKLGLTAAAYDALVARTGSVIHGAASVSFTLPVDEARAINVEGTRRILDLAAASDARLDYVGTAYVAGERRGIVLERDLDIGQRFRNTYEQTKLEAETLVRSRIGHQRVAIYRPSIIVGDSRTGRTSSFKVLYWPLKIFGRGLWRVVPGKARTPVDVVPSDYVVDALLHLRDSEASLGQSHHLAAGPERSASLEELATLAAKFFGVRPAVFVDPALFARFARPVIDRFARGNFRRIAQSGRVYTPYLSLDMQFDTTTTRRGLIGSGIEVPRVAAYFETLFRYCVETDWGKRAAA